MELEEWFDNLILLPGGFKTKTTRVNSGWRQVTSGYYSRPYTARFTSADSIVPPGAQGLFEYYSKIPQVAKYVQIGLDATGKPILADCERAAQKLVVVRIDLA